jgi:hypothetical protein
LADVTLTGIITSLLGNSRAFLEIIPAPGKPAIKPILGEGERAENVEVVAINADKNEVTIKNGTVLTNLTFKVVKSAPTAAPPVPGVANPGIVNPVVPNPLQTTAAQPDSGGRRNVMVAGGSGAGQQPQRRHRHRLGKSWRGKPGRDRRRNRRCAQCAQFEPGLRSIPQRAVRPSPRLNQPRRRRRNRPRQLVRCNISR